MLKEPLTVLVQAMVGGPGGVKLNPGQVYKLDDSPYLRVLIKSGSVTLVDPPTLDMEFLEKAGYELRDGYSYPVKEIEPVKEEPVVSEEKETKNLEGFLPRPKKKVVKPSEEKVLEEPQDNGETTSPEIEGNSNERNWHNDQEKDNWDSQETN